MLCIVFDYLCKGGPMNADVFFIIATVLIVFFGVLIYLSDKENHRKVMDRQELISGSITVLQNKVERCESSLDIYRKTYIDHNESYNSVQEHLAKAREQMQIITRNHRKLINGQIKRWEIVLPKSFDKHLSAMKSVKAQLDQF